MSSSDYWRTLKSFIKPSTSTTIPPIFDNGSHISDSDDKAKLLNDFFVSQTTLDESAAVLPDIAFPVVDTLNNIMITSEEVKTVLQTLKLGKSSGPDNINNRILKEIAIPISEPLSDLYNFSLSHGGITIYRNGPERTFVDTETDFLSTETASLGTETDRNGPKRNGTDQNGLSCIPKRTL